MVTGNLNHSNNMPDILYIMGTGRSGTTILEILLSNSEGLSGVGEVTHIFRDGFINDEICSCGQHVSNCEMWLYVKSGCEWPEENYPEIDKLFVKIACHSNFPVVLLGLIEEKEKNTYRNVNSCIFKKYSKKSRSSVIVDSSKYAGRGLQLARMFPDRVKVICLTRAPSGLVSAFAKSDAEEQKPKSLISTLAYYVYTMTCFRIVKSLLGKHVLHVRYEDLISEPIQTLNRIERWCGYNLSRSCEYVSENQWLEVGHIVTGNRLRRQGRVRFMPSQKTAATERVAVSFVVSIMNMYRLLLGFNK